MENERNALFMPVKKQREKEKWVESLLSALDSLWGKLAIIFIILTVGFKTGCFYQETKMTRDQLQLEKEQWVKWIDRETNYRSEIDILKQERLELKYQINKLKFLELHSKGKYEK